MGLLADAAKTQAQAQTTTAGAAACASPSLPAAAAAASTPAVGSGRSSSGSTSNADDRGLDPVALDALLASVGQAEAAALAQSAAAARALQQATPSPDAAAAAAGTSVAADAAGVITATQLSPITRLHYRSTLTFASDTPACASDALVALQGCQALALDDMGYPIPANPSPASATTATGAPNAELALPASLVVRHAFQLYTLA